MARIEPEHISVKRSSKSQRFDPNQQPLGPTNFERPGPPPRRRGRKFLVFILLLLIIAAAILVGLAWSGIRQIPYLSDKFYELPQPVRIVEVDSNQVKDFEQQGVIFSISEDDAVATTAITERHLTYLLRTALSSQDNPIFAPTIQAVITPDYIELFGLMLQPIKINITLHLLPFINDSQKLDFKITNVKAGNLPAPQLIVDFLNTSISQRISELRTAIEEVVIAQSVEMNDGKLILTGKLNSTN